MIMSAITEGEEEEGVCKLLPADKAEHLCQLWQSGKQSM